MSGTFFGLSTALSGLEAQQAAIDITGQNTANATTPGYSRQIAVLDTTDPVNAPSLESTGPGQMGTGVDVATIQRAHDRFVQQQLVFQNGQQALQQGQSDTLTQVSQVFNEPTSQGFSNALNSFFSAWQSLASAPTDGSAQESVAAQGAALASSFQSASASLVTMQQDQNKQVGDLVGQVNGLTAQIATLNQQIASVTATGQAPNDLEDKRDQLTEQLSSLVGIQETDSTNGGVNISLAGGSTLVQGASDFTLATTPNATNPQFSDVVIQGRTAPLSISGGQLGSALTARDSTIASRITDFNALAASVITAVNALQSSGYGSNGVTGIPFFTGSSASTIAVNPEIANNLANIATASAANQPGDGSVAQSVAQLQNTPPAGGTMSLSAQYSDMITKLGVDAQQAQSNVDTSNLIVQQLTTQQSSVSGVSLNEEASNLIQYQNAYQASAEVISIMNQTISSMIQTLGG